VRYLLRLMVFLLGSAVLALAGCAQNDSLLPPTLFGPPTARPSFQLPKGTDRQSDKIVKLPTAPEDLDCPDVGVAEGGASARVGGASSQEVRYQFTIGDVARECDPQGNQFALKVGVSGRVLIGPAGSPGAYSTTLHVQVKRDDDGKLLVDKSYKIAADTAGADQAPFNFITEPLMLPLTRARLDQDYSIMVSLGQGGGQVLHVQRARRRG
jgi:hypothetical protein